MKRGDIYYIDLSEDDLRGCEQGGLRPCVVVQNNIGNKHSTTIIVALISAQTSKSGLPTHVDIPKRSYLERDSIILTEQIRTVDKSRLRHKIAKLNAEELSRVDTALKISFGIAERS